MPRAQAGWGVEGWENVGLVAAGSAGPLIIALMNLRSTRKMEALKWLRTERRRTQDLYARFVGACTQLIADWSDYAHLPPKSSEEERDLDARRDVHYAELNTVSAMVRLSAPPDVAAAAEGILAAVRTAQQAARAAAAAVGRGAGADDWPRVEVEFAEARRNFVEIARRHQKRVEVA